MKKFVWSLTGLVLIFSLIFLFSGCDLLKKAAANFEKDAELASKALGNVGYTWSSYNSQSLKTINYNTTGDISGSQYASNLSSPTTFSLTFIDETTTVEDKTVTFNGTVNFGWAWDFTGTSYTFKMVIYSDNLNVKVDEDDMGNVPVDLYFSFSASASGNVTATIEGNVGSYTINTQTTINASIPSF